MAGWSFFLSTCVALQLNTHPQAVLLSDKKVNNTKAETEWKVEMIMVAGCGRNPGAGMDDSLGFTTIFKDGYFHVRCMMDEMHKIANYHNELTRVHEYKVHTNVSIVKYEDRVDVEKQVKMTPRICFDFCRTIPDMNQFGLVYGRECYCTPYYHQIPGDGVCSSPCEGDNTVTCGNQDGMADIYEMHTCGDSVSDAQKDTDALKDMLPHYHELAINATHILHGLDDSASQINVEEMRHPVLNASRELAALIRPLKEANVEGEAASVASDDYLATVTEGTTNAHKVKHLEGLQERCNGASDDIKKKGKVVEDWLAGMSSANAMKAAGITKKSAQELGESLENFLKLYAVDPFSSSELEIVKSALVCDKDLFDCENDLRYYWLPNSYTYARDVNEGKGSFRVSEVVEAGAIDFNELQKETVVYCAELCQETELCHFFYSYVSLSDRRDKWDSYKYQYCGFYTITDVENCAGRYHIADLWEPYEHVASYYYSYEFYYYYYYYNSETGEGGYNMQTVQYYYSVQYDYTWYGATHTAIKNDYTDCVGAFTSSNIEGIEVGR